MLEEQEMLYQILKDGKGTYRLLKRALVEVLITPHSVQVARYGRGKPALKNKIIPCSDRTPSVCQTLNRVPHRKTVTW